MPMYIKDDVAAEMAEKLKNIAGLPSKTEAVRVALRHEIERLEKKKTAQKKPSSNESIKKFQDACAALGTPDPNFDMKEFSDWINE